jgi:hypothetical protein
MKFTHFCLFALLAVSAFAATTEAAAAEDGVDIADDVGFLVLDEDESYLYVDAENSAIYIWTRGNSAITYTFGFGAASGDAAGLSVELSFTDDRLDEVIATDLFWSADTTYAEDGTNAEDPTVAWESIAPSHSVIMITLADSTDSGEDGDVDDAADQLAGDWAYCNFCVSGSEDLAAEDDLDLDTLEDQAGYSFGTIGATDMIGNWRFNLWNGIWYSALDGSDVTFQVLTNQDSISVQIGEEDTFPIVVNFARKGAHWAAWVQQEEDIDMGQGDLAWNGWMTDADYEGYALLEFAWTYAVAPVEDEDYMWGWGDNFADVDAEAF